MQFSDPNAGSPYNTPYGNAGMPYMGGMPRRRSRSSGCLGCLAPLLFILIVLVLLSFGFGWTLQWGATVIQVGANPTLVIESVHAPHTQIYIHTNGKDGQIAIQPVRPLNLPVGLAENYQETKDRQTVIYNLGTGISGVVDITVPTHTNLKIDSNDASILVNGITGQMHLETLSGLIIVKNSVLIGPSLLRSNSGDIQATQDQLSGSVVVDNNSASITFQGALEPAGNYRFTANGQPITLTVPQNTALQVSASTIRGSITSNIPGIKAQTAASGFALQASLGTGPRAQLTLYNNGGSITLNEQGGQ